MIQITCNIEISDAEIGQIAVRLQSSGRQYVNKLFWAIHCWPMFRDTRNPRRLQASVLTQKPAPIKPTIVLP